MRLIVGLGNPGSAYTMTRHNAGFLALQAWAIAKGWRFRKASDLLGEVAEGGVGEEKVILLLPSTFMNSSGDAVKRCLAYYKIPVEGLLVLCDDAALPFGSLRLRPGGSAGGHNGLKDIEEHLATQGYGRLRIGIGEPGMTDLAEYVLSPFTLEERAHLGGVLEKVIRGCETWLVKGIDAAMRQTNTEEEKAGEK